MQKKLKSPMSKGAQLRTFKEVQPDGKEVQRDGAWALASSANSRGQRVSPTSERIIKETSVKRRKAMKVLANR